MNRVLIALAAMLAATSLASAQQTKAQMNTYNNNNIGANGQNAVTGPIVNNMNSQMIGAMCGLATAADCVLPPGAAAGNGAVPHVSNLAALRAASTVSASILVRDGYAVPGDAPPLSYVWQASCPGTPDNLALYVAPTTGTGCWSAVADPNVWALAGWGVATTSTDNAPNINTALTAASLAGRLDVTLPSGVLNQKTTINLPHGVHLGGQGGSNYGYCVTTLKWTGVASAEQVAAKAASGNVLVNVGLHDLCLDGNSLAGVGFVKLGVQWGRFSNLYIYGQTTHGVYEDVAPSAIAADQLSTWDNIYVICGAGDVCWEIGNSQALWDVASNTYRKVSLLATNTAGFICGNADGNHFQDFYANLTGGSGYSFRAKAGTTNTPAPNSCRENIFTGEIIMAGGMKIDGNGAFSSFGNMVFGYKLGDGEAVPTIDPGASLVWMDTYGDFFTKSVITTDRTIIGAGDTGEAFFEVNSELNFATAAKFGDTMPLYLMTGGNDEVGFNTYWNGTQNVFGNGSAGNWAGAISFSPSTGTITLSTSNATGNAGGTVTGVNTLTVDKSGNVNAAGSYSQGGTVGITKTCTVMPTGITIKGGIITAITGGTCS